LELEIDEEAADIDKSKIDKIIAARKELRDQRIILRHK